MKTLLRLLLKSQHQRNRSGPAQTEKGMTLVELLVGAIMAFLIITPMIGFVVDMLNTDRREQVKSNTEQDIQAAVDFIAQDLSQAIYIYDNNPATTSTLTTTATGIPALIAGKFIPADKTQTPILVFWKRRQIKYAVPVDATLTPKPDKCYRNKKAEPGGKGDCNDAYVLSLVAYYQVKDQQNTWCQPSGGICPTRIARYEISDGVKDPSSSPPANPYYYAPEPGNQFAPHPAFEKDFDISKPTEKVTLGTQDFKDPEVLVNYIDHSEKPIDLIDPEECQEALGKPTTQTGIKTEPIPETTLRVTDNQPFNSPPKTDSFYACVDTSKNIARVTIRGNSLRRLQPNDTDYKAERSAYFPTASVQVEGLGRRGQ
jgi:type II secretory pathway pseudopilin PulG